MTRHLPARSRLLIDLARWGFPLHVDDEAEVRARGLVEVALPESDDTWLGTSVNSLALAAVSRFGTGPEAQGRAQTQGSEAAPAPVVAASGLSNVVLVLPWGLVHTPAPPRAAPARFVQPTTSMRTSSTAAAAAALATAVSPSSGGMPPGLICSLGAASTSRTLVSGVVTEADLTAARQELASVLRLEREVTVDVARTHDLLTIQNHRLSGLLATPGAFARRRTLLADIRSRRLPDADTETEDVTAAAPMVTAAIPHDGVDPDPTLLPLQSVAGAAAAGAVARPTLCRRVA